MENFILRYLRALLLLAFLYPMVTQASTYYVSTTGNDTNTGKTPSTAFKTIQKAANVVIGGDSVLVLSGTYKGFDLRRGGTAIDPIVFKAQTNPVLINTPNGTTNDGINIEEADWVVLEGFIVNNQPRNGIRVVSSDHVTVRNNSCDKNFERGILTGFANDLLIEGNTCTNSIDEHGIYVSNSGDRPIVRNNTCHHNNGAGIQMNADASLGGDGVITDGVIESNILYENGKGGGAAINLDGAVNTLIYNNLLYNNHATGIAMFMIDAASGSKNCKIFNNTIINASDSRWCILVVNGSTGVNLYNNILINQHTFRGSIAIDNESRTGFVSNYNIVVNRLSNDDGETALTLAQWQALGYDKNSLVAGALTNIFVDPATGNFHLKVNSQAIDKGTSLVSSLVKVDIEDNTRPSGVAYDIGAYEFKSSTPPLTSVKINFQPSTSAVPAGYLADFGLVYGARGNGYDYGWTALNDNTRDRQVAGTEARLNTFNHMMKPVNPTATWEIAVPNGTYKVSYACGDAVYKDQLNTLSIENTIVQDTDGQDAFDQFAVNVTVSDGKLTIKPGTGAINAKINYVDIVQLTAAASRLDYSEIGFESPGSLDALYPNPAYGNITHVVFDNKYSNRHMTMVIVDGLGKVYQTKNVQVSSGLNELDIETKDLPSKLFIIKIISNKKAILQKILIKR